MRGNDGRRKRKRSGLDDPSAVLCSGCEGSVAEGYLRSSARCGS